MSGRAYVVCDYAHNQLLVGDRVVYAARRRNSVAMTDATIVRVTARTVGGRLRPMLLVRPTGPESSFAKRMTTSLRWIEARHVRLIGENA